MYENNNTQGGIVLRDATPEEESETIDWDAVLRDFVLLQVPAQLSEEDIRELMFLQRLGVANEFASIR